MVGFDFCFEERGTEAVGRAAEAEEERRKQQLQGQQELQAFLDGQRQTDQKLQPHRRYA